MVSYRECEKINLDEILIGRGEEALIEILHKIQDFYGYIPREEVDKIARELSIPISKIYGVNTFYSSFDLNPKGKYQISVCLGTACYVKGAQNILDEFSKILNIKTGETTEDLRFSIINARCLGECADAPVVAINDKIYRKVTVQDVHKILREIGGEL